MMVMLMMVLVVVTAAAVTFLMVVMLMMVVLMMMVLMFQRFQILLHGGSALHSLQKLFSRQFSPGSGYQCSGLVMLPQQFHSPIQLRLGDGIGTGQNNGRCGFDLIVVELTEVLHIDLHLTGIGHGYLIANTDFFTGDLFYRCHHIGQLAYTGGFNDHSIRMVLRDYFLQSLAKIAHQRAANTSGVHFCNVDTCFLQETAINADLTEFIFDEHQLLTAVSFLDHFFDQCGFACTQKTGINIDNCHSRSPSVNNILRYYTTISHP